MRCRGGFELRRTSESTFTNSHNSNSVTMSFYQCMRCGKCGMVEPRYKEEEEETKWHDL